MTISEIWKPVPLFEEYEVSNLGNVRRRREFHTRQMNPSLTTGGYKQVILCQEANKKPFTVHRLVLVAFIGPRPRGHDINHKNGNKTDNRLENLEYATKSENMRHAYQVLKRERARGEDHGNSKLTAEKVLEIRRLAEDGLDQTEIAARFGITRSNVSAVVCRKSWAHLTT